MALQPSPEFRKACRRLFQDVFDVLDKPEDFTEFMMRDLDRIEMVRLRSFLDGVLSARHTDEELMRLYRSTDAQVGPDVAGIRAFLQRIRDYLRHRGS